MADRHLAGLIRVGGLVALALAGASEAMAQAPPVVAALEQFRDSLTTATDTSGLRRLDQTLGRIHDTSSILLIRRGLVALRLGTIWDLSHAKELCRKATDQAPQLPYPWFCLGLADEGYGKATAANPLNLTLTPGQGDIRRAADHYLAALQRDPGLLPAATALGMLVVEWRGVERQRQALTALRNAVPLTAATPSYQLLLLLRGRLERLADAPDSAMAAFRAYAFAGGDSALALLEEARTELARGADDGDSLYDAGAALDDSATTAGYRWDLRLIASDSLLRSFDAARGIARAAWLRGFWSGRDLVELRSSGTRLRDHYRRLLYAQQHFVRGNTRRSISFCEPHWLYDSNIPELDDRGIIYVRHGDPEIRVTTPVPSAQPGESWRYLLPGADTVVLHFIDLHTAGDFELVPSVFDLALGPDCRAAVAETTFLLQVRTSILPDEYSRWLAGTDMLRGKIQRFEREHGTDQVARAVSTDTDPLRFARELRAQSRATVMGAHEGRPLVHVAIAVRVPDSLAAILRLPPTVHVAVVHRGLTAEGWDVTPASLRTIRTDGGWWWLGVVTLATDPGPIQLRAAWSAGDSTGVNLGWDSLTVDAPDTSGPSLSPLIVAGDRYAVPWITPAGDTAFFSPFPEVERADPVELYASLAGALSGAGYTASLTVAPAGRSLWARLFGGKAAGIALSWTGTTTAAATVIRRTLGIGALAPGNYVLRLDVKLRGTTLRRETTLTIH
ncbi:MAG: hypothetical protein ACHQXA_03380 [Gemmatimonadales bacterium]